jgi:uncharacterized RDD family membrane protein YckC
LVAKGPRCLTDEPLHVAHELLGLPLAGPLRRAVALGLDYLVLILPVVAVAMATAALSLRMADPEAFGGLRSLVLGKPAPAEAKLAWAAAGPLLVRLEAPGLPSEAYEARERGDQEKLAEALEGYDIMVTLAIGEREEIHVPRKMILLEVEKLIPKPIRALALFGIAALYFTLCHASRRGQTLGKRLLGIRVAQLGGERLSLFESFERAAAYLEIPATLGLSLVSLWRDPNRRLPHDRVVHTAVLRVERTPEAPGVLPPEPPAEEYQEEGRAPIDETQENDAGC